jgi:hypothetical protein
MAIKSSEVRRLRSSLTPGGVWSKAGYIMHDRYEVELRIPVKSLAGRGATFMERKVKAAVKEFGV